MVALIAFSLGAVFVRPTAEPTGVLDEAAARIARDAARPVDQETLEKAAVEGMLGTLGDQWSSYYGPAEFTAFSASLEGRYTGVGVWLKQQPDGAVVIASVQRDTPADEAGVLVGSRLSAIDGLPVVGLPVSDVAGRLRGELGEPVELTLVVDGQTSTVVLSRVAVAADDVTVEKLDGNVLSVTVSAFTRGAGRQVRAAIAADSGNANPGIVLDLRGNPGGLVDEAVEVAGAFLDGGVVVSYDRRGRGVRTLQAAPGGVTDVPLVVLVDGETASAAEIVTAALQDRGRAVIVGSRTYGKGSVQEPATLSDGSAIELTVGQYVTPGGHVIDSLGIDPDIVATNPEQAQRRALDVLLGLVASVSTEGRG